MRILTPVLLAGLLLAAACDSGNDSGGAPSSELVVLNDATDAEIASGAGGGQVQIEEGTTIDLQVVRRVFDDDNGFIEQDVTGTADYNIENPALISVVETGADAGLMTGLAPGESELQIVFDDADGDPTDNDSVTVAVIVFPAEE